MKKKLRLIFSVITSFVISVIVSFIASMTFFGACIDTPSYASCPGNPLLFFSSFVLFLIIFFIIFMVIARKIGSWNLFFNFILILGAIVFTFMFLISPRAIKGGNAGKYKEGQTVLSTAKFLLPFRPIQKGDVVNFNRSDIGMDGIAYIIGIPGESIDSANTYYLTKPLQLVESSVVPGGFFAGQFGESKRVYLIPENQITSIVWYGLPINK